MNTTLDGLRPLLGLSSGLASVANQLALFALFSTVLLSLVLVYGPLVWRWIGLWRLDRRLHRISSDHSQGTSAHRDQLAKTLEHSPLASQWGEFQQRWIRSQNLPSQSEAPIHFAGVLQRSPLLPDGIRRTALHALPGLLIALGVLTGVSQLSLALEPLPGTTGQVSTATAIAISLRAPIWALGLAICAGVLDRLLRGAFSQYSESIDRHISTAFNPMSDEEWAHNMAHRQSQWMDRFRGELAQFNTDLVESIDGGLARIEQSTASAANLVSEEQRQALQNIVAELSIQMQRGMEEHLLTLSEIMAQAIEHQGAVPSGLADGFQQMAESAQVQRDVAESLAQTTTSVGAAAEYLDQVCVKISPLIEHMTEAGTSLQQTASTMHSTQRFIERSANGIRISLEQSASSMTDQHEFIESSLGEVRATLSELSQGLGEKLGHSLRNVDERLEVTVGRLRDTITESNETIHRMAGPIRAAEESTRTMQSALEHAQLEISGTRDWVGGAISPIRSALTQLNDRTIDVARALSHFGESASSIDHSIANLRDEIREEGRRFRQSTSELGRNLQRSTQATASRQTTGWQPQTASSLSESQTKPIPQNSDFSEIEPSSPAPRRQSHASSETAESPQDQKRSPVSNEDSVGTTSSGTPVPETGRWLGPDPYARAHDEAQEDLDRTERLLDALGPMSPPDAPNAQKSLHPLNDPSNGLSGLLGRSDPAKKPSPGQSPRAARTGEEDYHRNTRPSGTESPGDEPHKPQDSADHRRFD